MSTTITMWLGIAFVLLGVVAVILQAWLWSFPMLPDPGGPDPHGKSAAPRSWTNIHRVIGVLYSMIYVILMIEMVPRLWAYQVELPARTVVHASMGITIGVLLITKVAIIRWFQHFGQALPSIGLALMICTLILGTLSIPYALQAHDFGDVLTEKNLARVGRVMETVKWEEEDKVDAETLVSEDSMTFGRKVLVGKCVACHDMRTILKRPRNANSWYKVVKRMQEKPAISRHRIVTQDVAPVTAYLVAITPDLQQSKQRQKKQKEAKAKKVAEAKAAMKKSTEAKTDGAAGDKKAAPTVDMAKAKKVYEERCAECHELDEVDAVAPKDEDGWKQVVQDMVDENDAEFSAEEVTLIVAYLVKEKGK